MSMKLQLLSSLNVFVHNENLNQWVFQARCLLTNVLFLIIQNLIKCHEWQGWLNQHFQYYSVQYLLLILLIVTLGYISKCNKVELESILCELKQKQFLKYFNIGFHCFKLCLLMFTFVFIFNTKTKKGNLQGDKQHADCKVYSEEMAHTLNYSSTFQLLNCKF